TAGPRGSPDTPQPRRSQHRIREPAGDIRAPHPDREVVMAADFFIGESLVGDGNEVAHIDLIIGSKSGPAGQAFVNALSNQREGHSTLLAVVSPNLPAKPDALLFNKVTIKRATHAVQMFGPSPAARTRADLRGGRMLPKSRGGLPPLDCFRAPFRLIAEHEPRCVSSCCNSTAPSCRVCSIGWWRTTAAPTR